MEAENQAVWAQTPQAGGPARVRSIQEPWQSCGQVSCSARGCRDGEPREQQPQVWVQGRRPDPAPGTGPAYAVGLGPRS